MFLQDKLPRLEFMGAWGRKLFVILVILMTMANAIAPDNAFGKGTGSFGHASMSRGYSGGSFGGAKADSAVEQAGQRAAVSAAKPGYGGSFGSGGRASSGSFSGPRRLSAARAFGAVMEPDSLPTSRAFPTPPARLPTCPAPMRLFTSVIPAGYNNETR